MSTVSLEEFLKPISQALGRTEPPASIEPCEATKAPLPGDYRDYSTEELAQWFTEEATKMGTMRTAFLRPMPSERAPAIANNVK